MARVQLRELPLAMRRLALGLVRGVPLPLLRPVAEAAGADPLGLQRVDAPQKACEEAGGVAANLVPAQREVVEPVEQHREPVRCTNRGEERVQPGLERVLAKETLGGGLV